MPYIPHTPDEVEAMLSAIGADSIEQLFDEIPSQLRSDDLSDIPLGQTEMEISRTLSDRAMMDGTPLCFAGGGAYEHYIPAAVWEIATRGEFYSAYTPYQAEASQGTLQVVYEFQSMIASLTAMDVSNASLYDGASGLAEAVLMAVRANRKAKSRRILMPATVSPVYRQVVETIVKNQSITLELLDFDRNTGTLDTRKLFEDTESFAAMIVPMPNYLGSMEEVHQLTDWAHEKGGLVIGLVNPLALALLEAPGNWGQKGADIAVGEAQPLGAPLASGGPYVGFMACTQKLVRQLPGRIVGRTEDLDGKSGFTLTLQAREQHIRRSKATSNICTNQGLLATAVTIYLALLGTDGLQRIALQCISNTRKLIERLEDIPGIELPFGKTVFHEFVIRVNGSAERLLEYCAQQDIVGGIDISRYYSRDDEQLILICVTETKMDSDLDYFADTLKHFLTDSELADSGEKGSELIAAEDDK